MSVIPQEEVVLAESIGNVQRSQHHATKYRIRHWKQLPSLPSRHGYYLVITPTQYCVVAIFTKATSQWQLAYCTEIELTVQCWAAVPHIASEPLWPPVKVLPLSHEVKVTTSEYIDETKENKPC